MALCVTENEVVRWGKVRQASHGTPQHYVFSKQRKMKLTSKKKTTKYKKLMVFHQKKKKLPIGVASINSKIMGLGKFPSDLDIFKTLLMHFKDSFLCVSFCLEPRSHPLQVKDFSNCHPGWSSYDSRATQLTKYWWPKTLAWNSSDCFKSFSRLDNVWIETEIL